MSYMKDIKEDFYQAINELIDDDLDDVITANDVEGEKSDLDEDNEEKQTEDSTEEEQIEVSSEETEEDQIEDSSEEETEEDQIEVSSEEETEDSLEDSKDLQDEPDDESVNDNKNQDTDNEDNIIINTIDDNIQPPTNTIEEGNKIQRDNNMNRIADDSVITTIQEGTTITGDIESNCSLEIYGTVTGDVLCDGKLSLYGKINGNCTGSEVYIAAKRLEGCIEAINDVKIGLDSIIIGDVKAASLHIAGAIKGEIDVNGPVIIDSTAVVKGDIKASSIQINDGAIIDGHCNLVYAQKDIESLFN